MEKKEDFIKQITSSHSDPSRLPMHAVDADISTYFSASDGNNNQNHWLQIEFKKPMTVVEFRLRSGSEHVDDFGDMVVYVGNTDLATFAIRHEITKLV